MGSLSFAWSDRHGPQTQNRASHLEYDKWQQNGRLFLANPKIYAAVAVPVSATFNVSKRMIRPYKAAVYTADRLDAGVGDGPRSERFGAHYSFTIEPERTLTEIFASQWGQTKVFDFETEELWGCSRSRKAQIESSSSTDFLDQVDPATSLLCQTFSEEDPREAPIEIFAMPRFAAVR